MAVLDVSSRANPSAIRTARELRQAMDAARVTSRTAVGTALGVHPRTIGYWLSGERRIPAGHASELPRVLAELAERTEAEAESSDALRVTAMRRLVATQPGIATDDVRRRLAAHAGDRRGALRQASQAIEAELAMGRMVEVSVPGDGGSHRSGLFLTGQEPGEPHVPELDGAWVHRWRTRAGLTQAEVGEHLGMSSHVPVNRWEKQRAPVPQFHHAALVSLLVGAAVDRLPERRRRAGRMSQTELGDRVGVSQVTISALEQGEARASEARWARIDEVLDAATTDESLEVTPEELRDRLGRIGKGGQAKVARRLQANASSLAQWKSRLKPIPPRWYGPLREALEAVELEAPRNRLEEDVLPALLVALEREQWLQRTRMPAHLPGFGPGLVRQAVAVALERGLVHAEPRIVQVRSGHEREYWGICPGRRPRKAIHGRDRVAELLPRALEEIGRAPGTSQRDLANRVGCEAKLARRVVAHAIETGAAVEAPVVKTDAAGRPLARVGVWLRPPGSTVRPVALEPWPGPQLRARLDELGLSAAELAEDLGVAGRTVSRWGGTYVPAPRAPSVREKLATLKPVGEHRLAATMRTVIALVERRAAHTRQDLARLIEPSQRRWLDEALRQLLDAQEIYLWPVLDLPGPPVDWSPTAPLTRTRIWLHRGPPHESRRSGEPVTPQELAEGLKWTSSADLARRLGVPPSSIHSWLTRHRAVPEGRRAQLRAAIAAAREHQAQPQNQPIRGDEMRNARKRLQLTQAQAAALVNVSAPQWSRWECEQRPVPLRDRRRVREEVLDRPGRPSTPRMIPAPLSPRAALTRWREEHHLTKRELAGMLGLSESTIGAYENGRIELSRSRWEAELRPAVEAAHETSDPDRTVAL